MSKNGNNRAGISHSRLRHGFTLIELLVVVSIIALLISILLPSLSQARRQAKRAVCMSGMRQLGIGLLEYQMDYEEYPYERIKFEGIVFGEGLSALWTLGLITDPEAYWCPSDQSQKEPPETIDNNSENSDNSAKQSYMYMYAYGDVADRIKRQVRPAELSIVEEPYGGIAEYTIWGNHNPDGSNVLFLDGHVKWVLPGLDNGWLSSNLYYGTP
ncbi:MAG: DUF1559 domain-containing protein [Sedimentisphaerales bacterium]|nr:DUF1559 domain-containing protein [Sedimentisphaerales bacterium]